VLQDISLEPWALALALLAGPLLIGFVVGSGLRRLPGRTLLRAPIVLACPIFMVVLGPRIRLGIWDSASIGVLAALGMVGGMLALQQRPREILVVLISLVVALAGVEVVVRLRMPNPPGFPAIEGARVFLPRIDIEHAEPAHGDFAEFHRQAVDGCSLLYPDSHPGHVAERTQRDHEAHGSVVYLGDSMTYGLGVQMDQTFPAVLERRAPSLFHFNLGFPGTSVDYHYVIARHWIDRIPTPVKLVVLGLYFNDILEIGQGMACCRNQSLLAFDGHTPVERCPVPNWVPGYGESTAWFLRNSPPPYPLRVAMAFSYVARYINALIYQRASQAEDSDRPVHGTEWDRMRDVLTALRAELARRDIPLVIVMMPMRAALEATDPAALQGYRDTQRMKELATSLGIRTLDSWEHFLPLVRQNGSSRYFIGSNDIHLTPEGHVEMANWLAANIDEIRPAGRAAVQR
jgi:hypothetical protein